VRKAVPTPGDSVRIFTAAKGRKRAPGSARLFIMTGETDPKDEFGIEDLYPHLSEEELKQAEENLGKYLELMVGTVKKSTATKSLAWLFRNVRQLCEGGLLSRTMYLATVACDSSIPSLSNSP